MCYCLASGSSPAAHPAAEECRLGDGCLTAAELEVSLRALPRGTAPSLDGTPVRVLPALLGVLGVEFARTRTARTARTALRSQPACCRAPPSSTWEWELSVPVHHAGRTAGQLAGRPSACCNTGRVDGLSGQLRSVRVNEGGLWTVATHPRRQRQRRPPAHIPHRRLSSMPACSLPLSGHGHPHAGGTSARAGQQVSSRVT